MAAAGSAAMAGSSPAMTTGDGAKDGARTKTKTRTAGTKPDETGTGPQPAAPDQWPTNP